jgi:Ras-related protein Rab-18
VIKIIVGNKVDKEFSRQVTTNEGAGFAQRQGALFVEASAKTAVGVAGAFEDVVKQIIDTPELWSDGTSGAGKGGVGAGVGKGKDKMSARVGGKAMPGNITLADDDWQDDRKAGACSC